MGRKGSEHRGKFATYKQRGEWAELLFMKRYALDQEVGPTMGTAALIIGALTIIVVGGVVSWAHNTSSVQKAVVTQWAK
ncbi:MAG TPA: hypothetical protein VGM18_00240 [Candidatus Sulfotelmatobacter sp.]|jgi:hypothetical protein